MNTRLFVFGFVCFFTAYAQPEKVLAQSFLPTPHLSDAARFVSDITIPDGTVLKQGETFIKTWRIANEGSTTWIGYRLTFTGGDHLGAPSSVAVPKTVPGQTVDISVPMVAPIEPGVYQSHWRMHTVNGTSFGQDIFSQIMVEVIPLPNSQAVLESRPILYLDIDGKEPVISAISPDGTSKKVLARSSEVGCLACLGGSAAVWSPDGKQLAYMALDPKTRESALYLQDPDGRPRKIISDKVPLEGYPIWSPDGKRIAVLSHGIKVVDVPTGALKVYSLSGVQHLSRVGGFMSRPNRFRWSPDSRRILLSWGAVVVLDATTGQIQEITSHPVLAEWAPNGEGVYYFDILYKDDKATSPKDWGGFYFKKLDASEPVVLMEGEKVKKALDLTFRNLGEATLWSGFMTLSPNGARLAILVRKSESAETAVYIYDTQSNGQIALDKPSKKIKIKDLIIAMDWSPNEMALAGAGAAGEGIGIKVLDLETEAWMTLTVIPNSETVGSLYVFGFKTISWAQ